MNRQFSCILVVMIATLGLACNSSDKTDVQAQPKPQKPAPVKKSETPAPAKAETTVAPTKKAVEQKPEGESKPVQKRVYFTNIKDGDTVKNPVKLSFGVDGMGVRPAMQDINDKTTGHHHLIIDADGIKAGQGVPMDAKHIHYGKGQTSTEVTLTPGKHTLRLQFADGAHRSYGPELSTMITVTVSK